MCKVRMAEKREGERESSENRERENMVDEVVASEK